MSIVLPTIIQPVIVKYGESYLKDSRITRPLSRTCGPAHMPTSIVTPLSPLAVITASRT